MRSVGKRREGVFDVVRGERMGEEVCSMLSVENEVRRMEKDIGSVGKGRS